MSTRWQNRVLTFRPGQLMCMICRYGDQALDSPKNKTLRRLFDLARTRPRHPATIQLLTESHGRYDKLLKGTPGGLYYNIQRDQEIIKQFLYAKRPFTIGLIRPLAYWIEQLMSRITVTADVCEWNPDSIKEWRGCPCANNGAYEKGRSAIQALLGRWLPARFRDTSCRHEAKQTSVAYIHNAKILRILAGHLKCITCHYGNGLEFIPPNPLGHDNLFEVAEAMRHNPTIPVQLVNTHCMVCMPCETWDAETGNCGTVFKSCVPFDGPTVPFDLLKRLNLRIGQRLPAARIMRLLYDKVDTTIGWCGDDACNQPLSYDWGRQAGLGFLEAHENPNAVIRRVSSLIRLPRIRGLLDSDEKQYIINTVNAACQTLHKGDRATAYLRLIERRFWNCWKTYLEKACLSAARLNTAIKKEIPRNLAIRRLKVNLVGGAIRYENRLQERVWSKNVFSTGFRTTAGRNAVAEMGVQAALGDQNLYFAMLCAKSVAETLKADAQLGQQLMKIMTPPFENILDLGLTNYLWDESDDCLLICLQPDERIPTYYIFIFNSKGVKLAQRFQYVNNKSLAIPLYTADWTVGIHVAKDYWSAEVAIPLALMNVRRPRQNTWRVNFYRIFGLDMPGPRLAITRKKRIQFDHRMDHPQNRSLYRAIRAPESWSYSADKPWHKQIHDLKAFGYLDFKS